MSEERPFLPWIIFLSVIALVVVLVIWLFSGGPGSGAGSGLVQHPLVGKWRNGEFWTLIVYEDRWAAANGVKCRWEPADAAAIRIELYLEKDSPDLPPVTVMADFRPLPGGDGTKAVLNFMGQDVIFDRIKEEIQAPEQPSL